jgi:hypothetical protein
MHIYIYIYIYICIYICVYICDIINELRRKRNADKKKLKRYYQLVICIHIYTSLYRCVYTYICILFQGDEEKVLC